MTVDIVTGSIDRMSTPSPSQASSMATRFSKASDRYAGALFDLAQEQGALEAIEADVKALQTMMSSSSEFLSFLKSPVYDAEEKSAAISAIAEKAKFNVLTGNFLKLIAQNRRLFALDEMSAAFLARLSEHRGEVSAEAISAGPLNDDQTKRLRGEIERYLGKAVNLTTSVDPDLLGGIVVKVGSMMVDSSLRAKLARLKTKLKEA
ncbi:MAG: F0F1 ATP synthase subunit delta [Pseudomonadota bacterium]